MKFMVLQHADVDGPGTVRDWLDANSPGQWELRALHMGDALPTTAEFDALIILGGPMNADEDSAYPWLAPEKALLREAIGASKHLLGICLGAQLIARAAGARVYPTGFQEIGWAPVHLAPEATNTPLFQGMPEEFIVFHWHGDTFDLPQNSQLLASTHACANQAFCIGNRILALQFHLEANPQAVKDFIQHDNPPPGPHVQASASMIAATDLHAATCRELLFPILNRWSAS